MNSSSVTIARNTAILALADIVARCLTLVLVVTVARRLGPERMGIYAFCVAITGFLQILANFGMDPLVMRLAARSRGNEGSLLMQVTYIKTCMFVGGATLFNVAAFVAFHNVAAQAILALFSLSAFFTINLGSVNCFFRARQKAIFEAACAIVVRIVNTVAGCSAVMAGAGLSVLACIEVASTFCGCAAGWTLFICSIDRLRFVVKPNQCIELLRSSWRFFLMQLSQTVTHSINPAMLPMMASATAAGLYSAAARLVGAFLLIPSATTSTVLPYLSKLAVDSKERYAFAYASYARVLALIGGCVFFCIALFARRLLRLTYGAAFVAAQPALVWGAVAVWLMFLNWPLSMVMISRDRENIAMRIMGLAAALHVGLSLVFIPRWQAAGAAAASAAAQAAVLLFSYAWLTPRLRREIKPISAIASTIASTASAGGTGWLLAMRHVDDRVILPVTTAIFVVASILSGALKLSDLASPINFQTVINKKESP